MSWTRLLGESRVTAEPTSKQELDNLRAIVQRCLSDTNAIGLSHEQRFIIAYDGQPHNQPFLPQGRTFGGHSAFFHARLQISVVRRPIESYVSFAEGHERPWRRACDFVSPVWVFFHVEVRTCQP